MIFITVFLVNLLVLKPATSEYNFSTRSKRERDEKAPSGTGRYKAMAWRFWEFIK